MMSNPAFSREQRRVSPRNRRRYEYLWLVALAAILVLPMLLIAEERRNLLHMGTSLVELRSEVSTLREEQARLSTELARITSPDRVVQAALDLGLRPIPDNSRFEVRLQPGEPQPTHSQQADALMVASLEAGE
jgi:cell division protein FtsL